MTHDGIKYKYPCDKSNYKAIFKSTLATHKTSAHNGVKKPAKFQCDQCDYTATTSAYLICQKKLVHAVAEETPRLKQTVQLLDIL